MTPVNTLGVEQTSSDLQILPAGRGQRDTLTELSSDQLPDQSKRSTRSEQMMTAISRSTDTETMDKVSA